MSEPDAPRTAPDAAIAPDAPPGAAAEAPSRRALRGAPEPREVALILGLVFVLNLVPGAVLQLVHLRWGLLLTQVFFIAVPVLLAIRWFYLDGRVVLALRRPARPALAGAVLGTLGLNHFLNFVLTYQDRFFPMPEAWKGLSRNLTSYDGPFDFVLLLALVGAVPGVCEEILFRGYVRAGLDRAFGGRPAAVLVGALVFAAFHLNPWRFPALLAIGLYLGLVVRWSGSLVPAVAAHSLTNVLSVVVASVGEPAQAALVLSPVSHAAAGSCLAASALLLRRGRGGSAAERVL